MEVGHVSVKGPPGARLATGHRRPAFAPQRRSEPDEYIPLVYALEVWARSRFNRCVLHAGISCFASALTFRFLPRTRTDRGRLPSTFSLSRRT